MARLIRRMLAPVAIPVLREITRFRNRHRIARAPRSVSEAARPSRPERVLILAWFPPGWLQTIADNIRALGDYSEFGWDVMNLWGYETGSGLRFPKGLELSRWDAIYVHCTLAYEPRHLEALLPRLSSFQGPKILMKQDEHVRTATTVRLIREGGFNVLLTCIPPAQVDRVYPAELRAKVRTLHVLTGYVTDQMRSLSYPPAEQRPIDIGYRGSPQPFWYGKLAWEKRQIAEVFVKVCAERNLVADIAFGWGDRFMGTAWFDFLGRCKATLGVESGASVFDFTGEIETEVRAFLRRKPDATFEEIQSRFLAPYEGNVYYNQISPRHFEAAACGTAQILYEGEYSGIFAPWRHYFPLRRDLANLDEVLARFGDPVERQRVIDAARAEIVMSPEWDYRAFVKRIDAVIAEALGR